MERLADSVRSRGRGRTPLSLTYPGLILTKALLCIRWLALQLGLASWSLVFLFGSVLVSGLSHSGLRSDLWSLRSLVSGSKVSALWSGV